MTNEEIINVLRKKISNPVTELNYNSNFELLIAVILSAQCTDKRVNIVTEKMFKSYNKPEDFAKLSIEECAKLINQINFFNNKAKNIVNLSKILIEKFNSQVPDTFEELITLPGVGRKTANVILAVAYNKQTFAVDTHVFRVCNRLGLCKTDNVYDCEMAIRKKFKKYKLNELHHLILLFGRYFCKAKKPDCDNCDFVSLCVYKKRGNK